MELLLKLHLAVFITCKFARKLCCKQLPIHGIILIEAQYSPQGGLHYAQHYTDFRIAELYERD